MRFINSQTIYGTVYKAIAKTLMNNNLTFQSTNILFGENLTYEKTESTNSFAGQLLKDKSRPWEIRNITKILPSSDIQQIHNLYLIVPTKHGMLLIDQHAAHERILYEKFLEEFKNQKQQQYQLAKPKLFELSLSDSEILEEHISLFRQLGFELEQFKDNTFFLHAIPHLFKDRDQTTLLTELIEDIRQDKQPKQIDKISSKMIAYLACRAAIKAGDRLTKKQAKELIQQLEKTPNNATCPHGRPVKIEIDIQRIHKVFKRN